MKDRVLEGFEREHRGDVILTGKCGGGAPRGGPPPWGPPGPPGGPPAPRDLSSSSRSG